MLALIAGTGDLPPALIARLPELPLICALDGFTPAVPADITFRLEQLGTFLQDLSARGVTRICMAGAIRRPQIDPAAIDAATIPLIPKVQAAMAQGDDGALRVIIALLEEAGFTVVAAHEIAPDLLPDAGVLTETLPEEWHRADAAVGEACIAIMGQEDSGQACVVRVGQVLAKEDADGTDAMLKRFCGGEAWASDHPLDVGSAMIASQNLYDFEKLVVDRIKHNLTAAMRWFKRQGREVVISDDGILFKAPKPRQDRRADLPLIGPDTAMKAVEARLSGIVIEAGGVMVLNQSAVVDILNAQGMFLWVRPKGGA